ncbi:hypothetical protein ABMA28_007888 [Loxostege sticticalis]|uniref:Uncharacterized protein n=1 Tax=Loxostege sticticalis TaxID=481309 RepID=A0ABD0SJ42_LOXSC
MPGWEQNTITSTACLMDIGHTIKQLSSKDIYEYYDTFPKDPTNCKNLRNKLVSINGSKRPGPLRSVQFQRTANVSREKKNIMTICASTSRGNVRRPSDDEFDYIFDTPRKALLRKKLKKSTLLNLKHRKVIKTLKQKARRLQKRNKSLKGILSELQKKRFISNDVSNLLSENVFAADLFNNMVKKIKKDKKRPMPKYTPEFRKFCLTLHYHSPRAYTYVRNTFDTCLPHPKTLYNWYCSIDGSPGFTNESFKLLKSKSQSSDKTLICGLIADEMAIRPQNIKGGLGNVMKGNVM